MTRRQALLRGAAMGAAFVTVAMRTAGCAPDATAPYLTLWLGAVFGLFAMAAANAAAESDRRLSRPAPPPADDEAATTRDERAPRAQVGRRAYVGRKPDGERPPTK